ncbi:dynein heavy chain 5 [Trichonephila clavipes]|nr:dynein heavy chain 5 [Trichonephila clavipes]
MLNGNIEFYTSLLILAAKQQKRKITDVSVGLQQQCSKKLLESVITSICDSLETLLYSTSYNEKATPEENLMKNPWFKAEVHLKDKKLVMEPSIDDIQEMINKAAMDIISASRQIIQWQYKEPGRDDDKSNKEGGLYKSQSKSDCSTVGLTLYRQVSEDKEVLQLYGSIQTCMKNTKLELDNYLELFLKYEHLWGKARNDEIQAFTSEKRELIDFEDKIKYYLQVRTEIELETNETTLGCIRLSLVPSRHGGTLNSHRALNLLVKFVEGKKDGRSLTTPRVFLPQNWDGTKQNRTVTCRVLKAKGYDRRKNLALSRNEFSGP